MGGRITTHVLSLSSGKPAVGVTIELWRLPESMELGATLQAASVTNGDGRLDAPIAEGEALIPGEYELVFDIGEYFRGEGKGQDCSELFFERIPIRFRVGSGGEHYHIPLLVAPGGYSTYRGS
ncbi:hydroxyisourate hydrolase [Paenibacillus sp. NPDC058071]|uniref:hydroxyisourate hydrolase n=1 Tax=Paenibacillus sp. NPDC058071 TaxID=3346326 RepID=UPI0036DCE255